jgi:hypothetical protein
MADTPSRVCDYTLSSVCDYTLSRVCDNTLSRVHEVKLRQCAVLLYCSLDC